MSSELLKHARINPIVAIQSRLSRVAVVAMVFMIMKRVLHVPTQMFPN